MNFCHPLPEARKVKQKELARQTLEVARDALDDSLEETDPLDWWPNHPACTLLYPVTKILLQIPDSSAENERSFSSAINSFVLPFVASTEFVGLESRAVPRRKAAMLK